ncbi:hypothetical protein [Pacificoceanicola onchidii]|uniref:hypothetical protein n=1 Tax=Pacificoceanicola onchidii TaxID=2562685 RepID=UPI0010A664D5|nr:hypothetical protein [Pacificoceanicola onchidii]
MSADVIKTKNQAPVQGTVNFIQHNLPGLTPGAYQVTARQKVSTQDDDFGNTYHFAVTGQRFSLNPEDLHVTYPPDQGEGEYNGTLPHVVLTKQTLPWQRYPTTEIPPRSYPDQMHDRDVPTWLGVLLFDAEDEKAFEGFRAQATAGAVRDLFIARSGSDPKQGYSQFFRAGDLGPDAPVDQLSHHLEYGEAPDDPCRYIDVPMALFQRMAPSVNDLKMMAHLRNVEITKKATQNGVPAGRNDLSKIPGTSDFALVMGSRIPEAGRRTFAHLVSLEGLEPFLPADPGDSDDPSDITIPTKVTDSTGDFDIAAGGFMRLISLHSWSFTSTGDSSQFENLVMGLAPKNPAEGDTSANYAIGLPCPAPAASDSPATRQAKNALSMGYTAVKHHTRAGDQTVSWYRGPLVPYTVETDTLPLNGFPSADAANRYNPDNGMFDVSYGGAWQLGRLLALQDKDFAVTLYNWRRDALRANINELETIIAGQALTDVTRELQDDDLLVPLLRTFLPEAAVSGQGIALNAVAVPEPQQETTPSLTQNRMERSRAVRRKLTSSPQPQVAALAQLQSVEDALFVPIKLFDWAARLRLLEGVPFSYIVPDEKMLPPESIRFFYLDNNWTDTLFDGALSIGRNASKSELPSLEQAQDDRLRPALSTKAHRHAAKLRSKALGMPEPEAPQPVRQVSGLLLRSSVVKGWPGLEVNGYADDGSLMDIVRFERLSPTVLMCLFEPSRNASTLRLHQVDIHEPAEGLHFGLSGKGNSVNVRYNFKDGDIDPGQQTTDPQVDQAAPFRNAERQRVIRMYRLSRQLRDTAKYGKYIKNIYEERDHLPSSEFALQMIRGVGLVSFKLGQKG